MRELLVRRVCARDSVFDGGGKRDYCGLRVMYTILSLWRAYTHPESVQVPPLYPAREALLPRAEYPLRGAPSCARYPPALDTLVLCCPTVLPESVNLPLAVCTRYALPGPSPDIAKAHEDRSAHAHELRASAGYDGFVRTIIMHVVFAGRSPIITRDS